MENNLWIINGKAYDLSEFKKTHPGGPHILEMNRGRDCTELFYSYHIMSKKPIDSIMKKFLVRDANEDEIESTFNWKETPVYNSIKEKLHRYFNSRSHKATPYRLTVYFSLFLASVFTYYAWFSGYWWSIFALPIFNWFFSSELLHSSTHYSVLSSSRFNELLSYFGIYHCIPIVWYHQHVIGHHTHTNVVGKDPDLNHFEDRWRADRRQKFKKNYPLWRNWIAPYSLATSYAPLILRGIDTMISGKYFKILNFRYSSKFEKYISWGMLGLMLFLPFYMMLKFGFAKGLIFWLVPRFIHGMIFYFFSQISHINHDSFQHIDETRKQEWVIHQISSTVDYSTDSRLWNFLSAGLCNQTVHHICPTVHPCHYPNINKLMKKVIREYNLNYTEYDNAFIAFKKHLEHIRECNDHDKKCK